MKNEIDQLTIAVHDDITKIYSNLKDIEMALINIRISVAKLKTEVRDHKDLAALEVVARHIGNEITEITDVTYDIKEKNKQIAKVNNKQ